MITRRAALVALGAGMTALPSIGAAQPVRTLQRVALLHPATVEDGLFYKTLVAGLRDMGYVEGRNLALDIRSGLGKPETLPSLAVELVRLKPEVLIAVGPAAVKAAMAATRSIPIVAIDLETDPVATGWIASMARPGGNVTGFFLDLTAMSAKWLQLLREVVPDARQIVLLWDASTGNSQIDATKAAARTFAVGIEVVSIASWDNFDTTLDAAVRNGAKAIVVLSSPTAFQYSARIAEITRRHRIAAISPFRKFAEAGGLMAYGPDLQLYFRRLAFTVDSILKGARPADLPVEQPTKFELVINLGTARALGVAVPQALLLRADEVIQ